MNLSKSKKGRTILVLISIVFVCAVAGVIGFYGVKKINVKKSASLIRSAVFLTNGQIYFGYLKDENDFIILENIYYLKAENLKDADENKKISIIKMGEEVHGPKDVMYINKDHVLFYEELKEQSKINSAIEQYVSVKNNSL